MKAKTVFYLSFLPIAWVIIMALVYYAKFNANWFRVIAEIITLPLLAFALVLLVMAFINWIKDKYKLLSRSLLTILLITITLVIFFLN